MTRRSPPGRLMYGVQLGGVGGAARPLQQVIGLLLVPLQPRPRIVALGL